MNKFLRPKVEKISKYWLKDSLSKWKKGSDELCKGMGIVNINLESEREKLRGALYDVSLAHRKALSEHVAGLMRGEFMEEGGASVLSLMMAEPVWSNETGVLDVLTNPFTLEE